MYGSARMRAWYGQGDYQRRSVGFAPGYYAAGGFFSKLTKGIKAGASLALKSGLGKAALSFVPGGGLIGAAASAIPALRSTFGGGLLDMAIASGKEAVRTVTTGKAGRPAQLVKALAAPTRAGGATALQLAGFNVEAPARKKRKKRKSTRRAAPRRRRAKRTSSRRTSSRRKRRSSYSRGDARESDGRWTSDGRVPMDYPHRGHYHPPKRRKRKRRGRVSFTTKDGRKVSF